MLIRYPTALYSPMLPAEDVAGNITYTISNNSPPKSSQTFLQLPPEEEYRLSSAPIMDRSDKRQYMGDLYSEVMVPGKSSSDTGNMPFEIGQVLDFSAVASVIADPYSLDSVELIQNNSVVDYDKFGLDADEVTELVDASQTQFNTISLRISDIGQKINVNIGKISDVQADINNATKLLNNITKVLGAQHPSAIKVQNKINEYNIQKTTLIDENTTLNSEMLVLRSDLETVRDVVR